MLKRFLSYLKSSPKPVRFKPGEPILQGYQFRNTRTLTNEEITVILTGIIPSAALCSVSFYNKLPESLKTEFTEFYG